MRQLLAVILLAFTLSASSASAAPKHRHSPKTEAAISDTTHHDEGIEAYSDTTSTAITESQDSIIEEGRPRCLSPFEAPFLGLEDTIGGGVIVAIIVLVTVFLIFVVLPIVVLILIIRYFIKRHNDRVMLAEKAIAAGQTIPENLKPVDKQSPQYLYKRGVSNLAIGVGLALMFLLWGSSTLAGIGVLVACYGLGQLLISRSGKKRDDGNDSQSEA